MARETAKIRKAIESVTDDTPQDLQEQIAQLKEDIAGIAATLANLGSQSVRDARRGAADVAQDAIQQGEDVFGDLKNRAQELENQLTSTVRERPIAALATALGIGYLLAALSRR